MDLKTYRAKTKLTQTQFAERLTALGSPATQSLVSQWESGEVKPPAERWASIEKATSGKVKPKDLRPDLFMPAGNHKRVA